MTALGTVLCTPFVFHGAFRSLSRDGDDEQPNDESSFQRESPNIDKNYDTKVGIAGSTECQPPSGESVDGSTTWFEETLSSDGMACRNKFVSHCFTVVLRDHSDYWLLHNPPSSCFLSVWPQTHAHRLWLSKFEGYRSQPTLGSRPTRYYQCWICFSVLLHILSICSSTSYSVWAFLYIRRIWRSRRHHHGKDD